MRYPGHYRHEQPIRWLTLLISLSLFLVGLNVAGRKQGRLQAQPLPGETSQAPAQPQPTATDEGVTRLRLYNIKTGLAVAEQSVALMLLGSCSSGAACPASSPQIVKTDSDGKVVVAQSVIRQKPKLYVSGYKLDTYFSFLNPQKPNELTLYAVAEGAKLAYDISTEEIPVWLTPAE